MNRALDYLALLIGSCSCQGVNLDDPSLGDLKPLLESLLARPVDIVRLPEVEALVHTSPAGDQFALYVEDGSWTVDLIGCGVIEAHASSVAGVYEFIKTAV